MVGIFLTNSNTWLYNQLTENCVLESGIARLVESRREAEIVVYLSPPWRDETAPDRITTFRPRDLRRAYVFSQHDSPIAWAPGMYASLLASRARVGSVGGFYVPHHHYHPGGLAEDLEAARSLAPNLLWSFVGTTSNHPVRRRLLAVNDRDALVRDTEHFSRVTRWHWGTAMKEQGRAAFGSYAESLGRASFVLCPRGHGPSSIRIFEALQVGRCPVIISDEWLPPPFVEWESCSIRVPESEVDSISDKLRERAPDATRLGRQARLVWEQFFSPDRQLQTIVRSAVAVHNSQLARFGQASAAILSNETAVFTARGIKARLRRHGKPAG